MMVSYKHFEVDIDNDGKVVRRIRSSNIDNLPQNEILIRVHYSSLNYKDSLSANGHKGITRSYPHTPGIDAAGIIEKSNSENFKVGEQVIVTSYDLGMNTFGGFSEYISVPEKWVVKLPDSLSLLESMIYGTAGFTAALAIHKILMVTSKVEKVLVTGASGGVGLLSLSILKKLGVETIAFSRKSEEKEFFKDLGVSQVISSFENSSKPLLKPIYSAVIDSVGGSILSESLKYLYPGGSLAACGMALSSQFESTVFPFILRGVNILGIDSAETPMPLRPHIWYLLANDWKAIPNNKLYKIIEPESIETNVSAMLNGKHMGRTVIRWK